MNFYKSQISSLFFVSIFIFSMSVGSQPVAGQGHYIETNFDAWFFKQSGSRINEAYALYLK